MALTRARAKSRRLGYSFIAIPHAVLRTRKYAALSAAAVKLLLDLFAQYDGSNNGDYTAAWRVMRARGWRSKDSLGRALIELRAAGLIQMTRQGYRGCCSLFGVTWLAIDQCDGKLDIQPTRTPSGLWRDEAAVRNAAPYSGQADPSGGANRRASG